MRNFDPIGLIFAMLAASITIILLHHLGITSILLNVLIGGFCGLLFPAIWRKLQ